MTLLRPLFRLMVAAALLGVPNRVVAQDPALVEALAPLLRAQDTRVFDHDLFETAAAHPDPQVRRAAALAIGRIGDHQGSGLLVRLLDDRDSTVVTEAIFALGLIHDSSTVEPLIRRLKSTDSLSARSVGEAATALIRIGSAPAAAFVESVLKAEGELTRSRRAAFVPNAVLDAWHLGARTPADAIVPFASDTSLDLRWRAIYSLGRARAPVASKVLLRAATDPQGILREAAVKALVRRYVDSAAVPIASVKAVLMRALDDARPGVRVNALASAATFADTSYFSRAASLLGDPDQNVRVAAAEALASMPSPAAGKALSTAFDRKDATWALKRAALNSMAKIDSVAFNTRVAVWLHSSDVRDRLVAIAALSSMKGADVTVIRGALSDPDPAVQAAALGAWRSAAGRNDSSVTAAARARLTNAKSDVRGAAAGAMRGVATLDDLDALVAAWRMSLNEGDSDTRLAIFRALADVAKRFPETMTKLDDAGRRTFLNRPTDPLLRREAQRSWPALAAIWGPVTPFETGRSLEDYRGVVRTLMLAKTNPHVFIETDSRGTVDIELLAHDAPLTVANFLRLVDRHYFDGIRWHRVVPNFVVQAGDPTGTGSGGPGWSIRDEINRLRYDLPMLGMALSGPDTGGSQWFINVSPQPHLDGGYTIFGQVSGSFAALARIVQGDLIRTIHR